VNLGRLVYLNECYVRRPWVYVGEDGFCVWVVDLPLVLCIWSPCEQEIRVVCGC
jgi:hypothetical protein